MHLSVVHKPTCRCQDPRPYQTHSPHDVAVYLWGRDLRKHTVYAWECPYQFVDGDLETVEAVLDRFQFPLVRHLLPMDVHVRDLPGTPVAARRGAHSDALVCRIGSAIPETPSAEKTKREA